MLIREVHGRPGRLPRARVGDGEPRGPRMVAAAVFESGVPSARHTAPAWSHEARGPTSTVMSPVTAGFTVTAQRALLPWARRFARSTAPPRTSTVSSRIFS